MATIVASKPWGMPMWMPHTAGTFKHPCSTPAMTSKQSASENQRFVALSDFRFRLRIFLIFSEDAAREEGITVLQYQLMLHT